MHANALVDESDGKKVLTNTVQQDCDNVQFKTMTGVSKDMHANALVEEFDGNDIPANTVQLDCDRTQFDTMTCGESEDMHSNSLSASNTAVVVGIGREGSDSPGMVGNGELETSDTPVMVGNAPEANNTSVMAGSALEASETPVMVVKTLKASETPKSSEDVSEPRDIANDSLNKVDEIIDSSDALSNHVNEVSELVAETPKNDYGSTALQVIGGHDQSFTTVESDTNTGVAPLRCAVREESAADSTDKKLPDNEESNGCDSSLADQGVVLGSSAPTDSLESNANEVISLL